MAHPPEKRMELRAKYIGGLPLEKAAAAVDVPYDTARRWYRDAVKAGEDWDRYKNAMLVATGGGIEQAIGRTIAAGLMRCEALLDRSFEDPVEGVKAMGTLGDTIAKLRAASKGMMPEADKLASENEVIKGLVDLFVRLYPGQADKMLATVEAWANGIR